MSLSHHSRLVASAARAAAAVMLVALAACGGDRILPPPGGGQPGRVTVKQIEIIGVVSMERGTSRPLEARIHGSDGSILTGLAVSWSSSDSSVAIVSNGVVFGQGVGMATITALAGGRSASTPVYIEAVTVQSVQVAPSEATISYGESKYFGATLRSRDGQLLSDRRIVWVSSDTSVAKVDSVGKVTARRVGYAQIKAVSEGKEAYANVHVTSADISGVWQIHIAGMVHDAWSCGVGGVELTFQQAGDSIYGEATPGPSGTSSYCTRVPGQTPTAGVSTPMPPMGPFAGRIVNNDFAIRFDFDQWEMRGRISAQSIYQASAMLTEGPLVRAGVLTGNRKR